MVKFTESLGVEVILNTEVKSITKEGEQLIVHALSAGKEVTFPTSLAVHAAGRTADINDLQLDKINVEFDKRDCS